ncbi:MAG: hypothetical protein CM15mP103_00870 [Gammaproteobacteria bacterium]|nr:MAG: hypothetical protein CM15mP103_00870 [Gammaproteobacteria bacterium]
MHIAALGAGISGGGVAQPLSNAATAWASSKGPRGRTRGQTPSRRNWTRALPLNRLYCLITTAISPKRSGLFSELGGEQADLNGFLCLRRNKRPRIAGNNSKPRLRNAVIFFHPGFQHDQRDPAPLTKSPCDWGKGKTPRARPWGSISASRLRGHPFFPSYFGDDPANWSADFEDAQGVSG